jgi:hypothetical protein
MCYRSQSGPLQGATGMNRREFTSILCGAAVAWPMAAGAQQRERARRIGVVMGYPEINPNAKLQVTAFRQQLQKLGWIEGEIFGSTFVMAQMIPIASERWRRSCSASDRT